MTNSSLWKVCCIVLFPCLAVSAQETDSQTPPPPATDGSNTVDAIDPTPSDAPRTYLERTSPATFGATVINGGGDRLLVGDVTDGSPADIAGLATGDTIVSINGNFVTNPEQFNSYLASHPADRMRVVVMRDGVQQTLVVNAAPDAGGATPDAGESTKTTDARPALGIRFLQANQVILQEVLAGSPAERAGLRPGDHVIAVNETPLASTDHFINLVAAVPMNAAVDLLVIRGRDRETISVTPAAWNVVFDNGSHYTTMRPAINDRTVTVPAMGYVGPAGYGARVSPVGVPTIAFPTYYGHPYGSTTWAYPYYPYYGGIYYYPNWYIHTGSGCCGPYPGDPGTRTTPAGSESTRRATTGERHVVETFDDNSESE